MPATALKTVQLSSAEGTWGSTGVATRKLSGVTDASLRVLDAVEVVPSLGWMGPGPNAAEVAQSGEGTISMVLSYEELTYLLNGVFTAIGASTSTTGVPPTASAPPYNYPYLAPTTSTQSVYTYTMEYGTTGATYRAPGSVVKSLSIKGEAAGLWSATVNTVCKQIVASTSGLSTGLTAATVNPIRMADTSLYIDTFTSTAAGGSAASATLIAFDLNLETNRHTKTFAGALIPGSWGDGRMEGTLKLTAEFNASAKALVDELLGSTGAAVKRLIRIGATQGSSASVKAANLDFAGIKVDGETLFSDRDGNMTVELAFQGLYSSGLGGIYSTGNGGWFVANVQNGSSSTT